MLLLNIHNLNNKLNYIKLPKLLREIKTEIKNENL